MLLKMLIRDLRGARPYCTHCSNHAATLCYAHLTQLILKGWFHGNKINGVLLYFIAAYILLQLSAHVQEITLQPNYTWA